MTRKDTLLKLINLRESIPLINNELSEYGWDYYEDLVILKPDHIVLALDRYLNDDLSEMDINEWANTIECREDIGISSDVTSDALHELANPYLTEKLSKPRAHELIRKLNS